ncbi:hypothetical protein M405DRAFT_818004 [Rhizopogon salebrosus TDB-379]|nr:hypothetical protein M405DRAFT_818004 [Rhizopogon salebrosus TDB-379]
MAPVAMYSSTVRDPRTSMTTNLEPSSIVRSLWEPQTLPSIIAYSSKPIDNRGGATLLEGTRESSRQMMLCLCSIPAITSHKKRQPLNSAHIFFEYPSPLVERYISANRSIDHGGL